MPLSQAFLATQVFFTVLNVFSKPSLFQILYCTFTLLCGYFQKVMSQQKCEDSHSSVKQYFWRKAKQFLAVKVVSHRIPLRLTNRLITNVSLHTYSKNTITDNHGNPACLNQFQVSRKPFETEKIQPDTANTIHV